MDMLRTDIDQKHQLTLMRSERALTDCRPVSIFSLQSARQLAEETGTPIDKRRFRANVYVDLTSGSGFAENDFVGRSLRIGSKVVVRILERDARCVMITLDPDTTEKTPEIREKHGTRLLRNHTAFSLVTELRPPSLYELDANNCALTKRLNCIRSELKRQKRRAKVLKLNWMTKLA